MQEINLHMTFATEASKSVLRFGQYLQSCLPHIITKTVVFKDELSVHTLKHNLPRLLHFLRDHVQCRFKMLVDITAVDYPQRTDRFELIYMLQSIHHNARIIVKTSTDELTPVPTATAIYGGACWPEREVYDMYGVVFEDHPDLRRILTDYGFEGHPLRKDFPLTGFTEVRWDEELKRVVSEPVEMTQEFRRYELDNAVKQPFIIQLLVVGAGQE